MEGSSRWPRSRKEWVRSNNAVRPKSARLNARVAVANHIEEVIRMHYCELCEGKVLARYYCERCSKWFCGHHIFHHECEEV